MIEITHSKPADIDQIFDLYKAATEFQIIKAAVPWPKFERQLIENEILEQRQWNIVIDNQITCVWAITDNDPQIWGERNKDPAIYIHRIATHPDFRGRNLVSNIVKWSINFAKSKGKKFVRMDTVGENTGLINHYKKCGFDFLGLSQLEDTTNLPQHYHNATVSLFQLSI